LKTRQSTLSVAAMPCPYRIGTDHYHIGHRFGLLAQVQQPNGDGALSDFRMHRLVDRLLNFGKLFIVEVKVYTSAHTVQFSSFVDGFRLLA
jgi:hypothetical protein